MARRVFFSFHYVDVASFRANVVRNHHVTKERSDSQYFDASIWEDAELHGSEAIKRLIHRGLENTSVTCVLIGSQTWERRWVRYEILKSYDRGNRLFGVHINGVTDKHQKVYPNGLDPFSCLGLHINETGRVTYHERDGVNSEWRKSVDLPVGERSFDKTAWGKGYTLSSWVPCNDWAAGDGYNNFASWIENAK